MTNRNSSCAWWCSPICLPACHNWSCHKILGHWWGVAHNLGMHRFKIVSRVSHVTIRNRHQEAHEVQYLNDYVEEEIPSIKYDFLGTGTAMEANNLQVLLLCAEANFNDLVFSGLSHSSTSHMAWQLALYKSLSSRNIFSRKPW